MGILVGIYEVVIQNLDFSTIFGALVGGLIVYLVQLKVLREARAIRAANLRSAKQALGYSIFVKLQIILSNSIKIENHFGSVDYQQLPLENNLNEPWQVILPIATTPSKVCFSDEERVFLLIDGSIELYNLISFLDENHNILIDLVVAYTKHREELFEKINPISSNGKIGNYKFSEDQLLVLEPTKASANDIAEQAHKLAAFINQKSSLAIRSLYNLLNEQFEFPYKLSFNGKSDEL